jgi:Holliday junction DNA helicase RuvB
VIRTPGADVERIQTPKVRDGDEQEARLRPQRLEEFVGQEALKAQLGLAIRAAQNRGEGLDHVLFAGPPGLGKTSLARIVANELGAPIRETAGPALERKAEIASYLTALEPGSIFFTCGRCCSTTISQSMPSLWRANTALSSLRPNKYLAWQDLPLSYPICRVD